MMNAEDYVKDNIRAHNKVAPRYDKIHDEIFNDVEQTRIRDAVALAVESVKNGGKPLQALDVGCGSGNLTRHLIALGAATVSADVSENFLKLIEQNFSNTGLSKTLKLNGRDLSNINDCTFDLAATYSVLHHVQDYLHLVREMCRVLKPGGILYIDHESNETPFNPTAEYTEFLKSATPQSVILRKYLRLLLTREFYVNFVRKRINPRFAGEGDIHVWPDDHIEWDNTARLLLKKNFEIVLKEDYLVYRSSYLKDIYEIYRHKCTDMTMLLARKKPLR
jgi:ubiquinone/menaquinone biosynthesis C-methylase UbiE